MVRSISHDSLRSTNRNPIAISLNVIICAPPISERPRQRNHASPRRGLPISRQNQLRALNRKEIPEYMPAPEDLLEPNHIAGSGTCGSEDPLFRPATSIGISIIREPKAFHREPLRPSTASFGQRFMPEIVEVTEKEPSLKLSDNVAEQELQGCHSPKKNCSDSEAKSTTATDADVPSLDISQIRPEDHESYPLPIESDRWYRRPGWKSQRVVHFDAPLKTENFVHCGPRAGQVAPDRRMAEWRWDVDASARRWHWQRVCRLRPAAEIFSVAHLRSAQRDAAAWQQHPPASSPKRQPASQVAGESPRVRCKEPVGDERQRFEDAVSALLSMPSPAAEGSWRNRIRKSVKH